jgi:hypothetical protein
LATAQGAVMLDEQGYAEGSADSTRVLAVQRLSKRSRAENSWRRITPHRRSITDIARDFEEKSKNLLRLRD